MMFRPSFTAICCGLFIAYVAHSMLSMVRLFIPPKCDESKLNDPSCLKSSLKTGDEGLRFLVLTTLQTKPRVDKDLTFRDYFDVSDLSSESSKKFKIDLPKKVREQNGTLYMAIFSIPLEKDPKKSTVDVKTKWPELMRHPKMTYSLVPLTQHHIPEAETFNLLGSNGEESEKIKAETKEKKPEEEKPVVHIKSKMVLNVMTDRIDLPIEDIPSEMYPLLRAHQPSIKSQQEEYLPIVYVNELSQRIKDLVRVNKTSETTEIEIIYSPIGFGKLRLFIQFANALGSMHGLGFTLKDTDEVKGIFVDTNLFLLLLTFTVSAIHLLFDFLAFKNDVTFWSRKRTMAGLSTKTVLWRAFSQFVIFLYLMDENTSLLVLIPSGIAAVIEIWKVTIAFKIRLEFGPSLFSLPKIKFDSEVSASEKETNEIDAVAMSYLAYLLYPLCIGGAAYSLLYTPHKSWYSWTIQSLVNGVYAFGFLFMLPQLFVNYKLKSVAHLPWRSFMYKAFNTFIDDLFAFIITMPTAHRVACFRDDVVFLIYLYQRWLYPVDQSRIDSSGMIEETCEGESREEKVPKVAKKVPEKSKTGRKKND